MSIDETSCPICPQMHHEIHGFGIGNAMTNHWLEWYKKCEVKEMNDSKNMGIVSNLI